MAKKTTVAQEEETLLSAEETQAQEAGEDEVAYENESAEEPEVTGETEPAEVVVTDDGWEPDPPSPEDIERWERERREREAALIRPYQEIAKAMKDRDEVLAELMFEVTMMEMEV